MTRLLDQVSPLLRAARAAASWLVRCYYPDLVVQGAERIPGGPLIIAANHPNALVDPLVLSVTLPRRVRWLAKATLFRSRAGGLVLRALGAIPVHRRHEGGTRDTTEDLLRAAAQGLASGHAIGIFPEGVAHDEARLKTLKTGAGRMAVLAARELAAAGSTEAVRIAPVVLYFPEKTRFRSGALVTVGEILEVRPGDEADEVMGLLQQRLEAALVHVEDAEQERLLAAVRELIQRRHALGGQDARPGEAHRVDREIAAAIRRFSREEPARVDEFRRRLHAYGERLDRHGFSLHALEPSPAQSHRTGLALACLPIALVGFAQSAIPYFIARWASRKRARAEGRTTLSTHALGAGLLAFPACWLPWAWWAHAGWGLAGVAIFLVTAPIAALIARWSLHVLRHEIGRAADTLMTALRPHAVRDLKAERTWLWGEIERWRALHLGGLAAEREGTEA